MYVKFDKWLWVFPEQHCLIIQLSHQLYLDWKLNSVSEKLHKMDQLSFFNH